MIKINFKKKSNGKKPRQHELEETVSVRVASTGSRDPFSFLFPFLLHPTRRHRRGGAGEVKGSGLRLLGVELVLQLHEFARRFDLVGNLLPLREETLALLEGQTLRVAAGDRVLLLLTAERRGWKCGKLIHSVQFMQLKHALKPFKESKLQRTWHVFLCLHLLSLISIPSNIEKYIIFQWQIQISTKVKQHLWANTYLSYMCQDLKSLAIGFHIGEAWTKHFCWCEMES